MQKNIHIFKFGFDYLAYATIKYMMITYYRSVQSNKKWSTYLFEPREHSE